MIDEKIFIIFWGTF